MLFTEIIILYSVNHMKTLSTLYGFKAKLLTIKIGGTYRSKELILLHIKS